MTKVGIEPIPPGETANFDGFSDLQVGILTVYVVTFVLATIGLALRFYTGACIVRNLGIDAFLLLASWATYLASFVGMLKVFPCGFGKHLWSVTEEQLQCYMDTLLFLAITYFWPVALVKLSLIALYHRIDVRMGYRIALYFVACAIVAYTIAFTVVLSGPCNPLNRNSSMCINNVALAQASLNIATDGILLIMPLFTLAIIASCVRMAYVRAMIDNSDVLYTQGSAAVWSAVEINVGILCNCLATMKPFVRRHMPWLVTLIGAVSRGSSSKARDSDGRCGRGQGSGGSYQLHSVGCDIEFGTSKRGGFDADSDGGGSPIFDGDVWFQQGRILVTTITSTDVAMSRENASHASTDTILRGGLDGTTHGISRTDGQFDLVGKVV